MHGIIALSVPKRGYVEFYNDNTKQFFISQFSYRSFPDPIEGVNQDVYMYKAEDIFETNDTIISTNIKPIIKMKVDTKVGDEDNSINFNEKTYQ